MRDHRPHAAEGQAGGHRHGVLLGDPHVEEPLRERGLERWRPVPVGMPAVMATIRRSVRADLDELGDE